MSAHPSSGPLSVLAAALDRGPVRLATRTVRERVPANRLLSAAAAVDDYFSGRMGAIVPDETRQAILRELSAAVAEAKQPKAPAKARK